MSNKIKSLDMFSTKFSLRIAQDTSMKTIPGAILTLAIIVVGILYLLYLIDEWIYGKKTIFQLIFYG